MIDSSSLGIIHFEINWRCKLLFCSNDLLPRFCVKPWHGTLWRIDLLNYVNVLCTEYFGLFNVCYRVCVSLWIYMFCLWLDLQVWKYRGTDRIGIGAFDWNPYLLICKQSIVNLKLMFHWRATQMARWGEFFPPIPNHLCFLAFSKKFDDNGYSIQLVNL